LYEIVKDTKPFGVLTILDINQGTYFRGLYKKSVSVSGKKRSMEGTYLERDMVIANTDLELLLPNNVLFWPVRVVFPVRQQVLDRAFK
jgi:hypothetical protein